MAIGRTGWQRLEIGGKFARRRPTVDEAPQAAAIEEDTAFINEGCEVEGTLTVKNSLRVQGDFRGRIESAKTVTVDERATVAGDIRARTVIIYGAVVGNLDAARAVVLHASGRLHGDVKTPAFELERGAFFNGRTEMYRPERAARLSSDEDLTYVREG
jgi:cytoskeletal protein CcmA (bactofilin family)